MYIDFFITLCCCCATYELTKNVNRISKATQLFRFVLLVCSMSQSEVFRPTNGALIANPGPVHEGYMSPMDAFRKQRPSTQSGSRFGALSQNSFFTRHNPHPGRVRHIKGNILNVFYYI